MVSFLFCWFLFSKRMMGKILCVKCKGQNERCPLLASSSWIMGGLWVLLTWITLGSPTLMLGYRRKGEVGCHPPFPDYRSPPPAPPEAFPISLSTQIHTTFSTYILLFNSFFTFTFISLFVYLLCVCEYSAFSALDPGASFSREKHRAPLMSLWIYT